VLKESLLTIKVRRTKNKIMEKTTLKIGGMTCASCASVIEYGLKKEKGINRRTLYK